MTKVLFIHHSTGALLIRGGKLRQLLHHLNPNIELWDHSYNLNKSLPGFLKILTHQTGLSDNHGKITGKDYNIVLSNNSPKEYVEIFSRDANDPTLKEILKYDIIAFKNCYPTTKIESDKQLEDYKNYYQKIRDSVAKYKNKFILVTPPPLREELTHKENALRAKKLAKYLTSRNFIKNSKNLFVFDLFSLLTDNTGFLRREYCNLIWVDSHPNHLANIEVAPEFAKFISSLFSSQANRTKTFPLASKGQPSLQ